MRLKGMLTQIGIAAVLLLACALHVLDDTEYRLQDVLYQQMSLSSEDIYVIGIDEKTLMELGPFESWSRSSTADLIDILCADPEMAPAVIGVDIGFYGEKGAGDARLAEAAARAGNVVVASYATFGGKVTETDGGFIARRAVKTLERPFEALDKVASTGFTNVLTDADGIVRHSLYTIQAPDGSAEKSFAHAVSYAFAGALEQPPLNADGQWYIPFSGDVHDYYGASFVDLLNGEADPAQFAGSIVLIGPYSAGMQDACYTPVSRSEQMYGVEVHANIIQALLEQNFKQELPRGANLAILLLVLLLAMVVASRLDLRVTGVLFAVFTAAYPLTAYLLYQKGWILPLIYPLFFIWAIYLFQIFHHYYQESKARRHLLDVFGKYVSPQVAGNIVRQGEQSLQLGGQTRDIAVLFVDIRGFTALSEQMRPEEVVEILNRYFALTTKAIFDNGGTVDKFIGDATMAVFNAPLETEDYVYRAVCTGLTIAAGAETLNEEIWERFGKRLGFGIGIHCGPAIVGNIGTSFRMEYTAIGDTVNVASRLEGQAEAGEVIVSEALYGRIADRVTAICLGGRVLKGKRGELVLYRVQGVRGEDRLPHGSEPSEHA